MKNFKTLGATTIFSVIALSGCSTELNESISKIERKPQAQSSNPGLTPAARHSFDNAIKHNLSAASNNNTSPPSTIKPTTLKKF